MKVGDKAGLSKTIMEKDINTFAELVGDFNPVHLDYEKAKNTIFGAEFKVCKSG